MAEVRAGEQISDRDILPQLESRDRVRVFTPEANSVGWGTTKRAGLR